MDKHILFGAILLSFMAISCSNEDFMENPTQQPASGKAITVNASINNGADTKLTYSDNGTKNITVAWSGNETFTMYRGTNSTGSSFSNSADDTGKFKGNDITGDGTYYAVYGGDNITNSDGTLTIDLSGAQVGTDKENGIKEFMLASADALTSETALTFHHKLTVLKLTLTLPSNTTGKVDKIVVSGLHNKATYNLSKTTDAYAFADAGKGDITATNGTDGFAIAGNKVTAYVAVFPESISAYQASICATVGDDVYYYSIALARELTAGKVIPVNVSMAKVIKYTYDSYTEWSALYCGSAVSKDQMQMYLGAGVYWDEGTDNSDGNQKTYQTPDGKIHHACLWMKKQEYISGFSKGIAKKVDYVSSTINSDCWNVGHPKEEIDKYFYVPATGFRSYGYRYVQTGSDGMYWSHTNGDDNTAYSLMFNKDYAQVGTTSKFLEFRLMLGM